MVARKDNSDTSKPPDKSTLEKYEVRYVDINNINPSPENDELYGEIVHDEQMTALIGSVETRGLEEPLILTVDNYVLSGHRRLYATQQLGWNHVPCRYRDDITWESNFEYHKALAEYNPQRVKTVGSLLKEALLRDTSADDTWDAIRKYKETSANVDDVDFMKVAGCKHVSDVSEKKLQFLMAAQKVVKDMFAYWPLSVRQIHYVLLNNPPLISTPKKSTKSKEHYRYRNNHNSYKALVNLLKSARYHGHIAMNAIDDPTRPQVIHHGYSSVSQFVQEETENFLCGYHRDRQHDQPRHIEILCEKNTVFSMIKRVADEYYVPLTAGRGFCSIPVWKKMAARFKDSGRESMTLIITSDWDPEGLELADDGIRSLRDLWEIPVEGHRVCVTPEQVAELDLAEDFNPAKPSSMQFTKFVERTGSNRTWELEALPPNICLNKLRPRSRPTWIWNCSTK